MDFWDFNLLWDAPEFHPLQNCLRRPQSPPSSLWFSYSSSFCWFFVLLIVLFFIIFVNFIIQILSKWYRIRSTRRTFILLRSSYICINKRIILYSYIIIPRVVYILYIALSNTLWNFLKVLSLPTRDWLNLIIASFSCLPEWPHKGFPRDNRMCTTTHIVLLSFIIFFQMNFFGA